ncbi:MAG: DUF2807 domain-containing protein [Sphingomonas sp.]|nr:DUF2807 domain-containing protein [Sphingomonas sp.]
MAPALALSSALSLGGCSAAAHGSDGAGSASASRSFAVRDFTGIDLRGSDDVEVKLASEFTVRADGPEKVLDRLVIERVGDTLRITRKRNGNWSWSGRSARIFVTMPRITRAATSGSGDMHVARAQADAFSASVEGSGDIRIDALDTRAASFSIAGSGDISATGRADDLTINIAGSGDISATGVKATRAQVSIAGSGTVAATVNGPATVSILGSGDVDLGSGATCTTSKRGSGDVRCGK